MRSKYKSIAAVLVAGALAVASVPAAARVGAPAPAPAKPAPAAKPAAAPAVAPAKAATLSRAGGGADSGMKRSNVMAQARAQQPAAAPAPAPARPVPNYGNSAGNAYAAAAPAQAPAQQPKQGYSGRQVAGAVAAGAVGGYLLHEATRPATPPAYPQPGYQPGYQAGYQPGYQPGYAPAPAPTPTTAPVAYDQPRYQQPAPVQAAPQVVQYAPAPQQSSGLGAFGWLVILAALGGIGYVLYRKFSGAQTAGVRSTGYAPGGSSSTARSAFSTVPAASSDGSSNAIEQDLLNGAGKLFNEVQQANNRGDKAAMARLVDETYVSTLTEGIDSRTEPSDTQVLSLQVIGNRVLGFEREAEQYVGSVHFQAMISEGGAPAETIQEVWHFVRPLDGGSWKLAGIEQV